MKKICLILAWGLLEYNFGFAQCTLSASISATGPASFCRGDSVVLAATTSGGNGGVPVLDQSQYIYNGGTSARNLPGYSIMQSFTPSLTGTLDEIDMGFFTYINGTGTLNIYTGTGDAGNLLQTQTVSVFCAAGSCLIPFNVSAQVTAGQLYTFDFTPGAGIPDPYGVQVDVNNPYPDGQMIITDPSGSYFPGYDLVFATYVASSGGTINYQWQRNSIVLSGDTGNTLVIKDSSGNYSVYVTDGGGCSDTSNLINVTVYQPAYYSFSSNICSGSTFNFNGRNYDTTGIYNDTLTASTGCDSIVQLQLSVISIPLTNLQDSICTGSSYNFGGQTIYTGGIYDDTLPSSSGCDSIVRLQLSVLSNPATMIYDSICKGDFYDFGGQNLFAAGTYYDTLNTTTGCDSLVILYFGVRAKPEPAITRLGGDTLTTSAFAWYQWLLNNAAINGATTETYVAMQNGNYSVAVSDIEGCSDTSAPVNILNLSVNSLSENGAISLYPNPTSGVLNVQTGGKGKLLSLSVFNELGILVSTTGAKAANNIYSTSLDLNGYAGGIYYLRLQFDDFDIIKRIELVH